MIQPDLLAPLEPQLEPEEAAILPGTMRGDLEAQDAAAGRVEVWCGPARGWLPFRLRVGPACVVVQAYGRLMAGPTFFLDGGDG